MLLALILAQFALSHPEGSIYSQPSTTGRRVDPHLYWRFAPTNTVGLGTVCADVANNAKLEDGGTMQFFASGSNAWCPAQGIATTGINASSFTQPSNKAWVVPNAAGGKGLMIYGQKNRVLVRSEELDNAAYVDFNSGAAAPTLNAANAAIGPPYGLYDLARAEDYTFPATGAAEYSARAQTTACAVSTPIAWAWVRNWDGGTGTIDVCSRTSACAPCTLAGGFGSDGGALWTQCISAVGDAGSAGNGYYIGNMSAYNGGIARDAIRVLVAAQACELLDVSPYVATGAANGTDDGPLVGFATTTLGIAPDAGGFCSRATIDALTSTAAGGSASGAVAWWAPLPSGSGANTITANHTSTFGQATDMSVLATGQMSGGTANSFISTLDLQSGSHRYQWQHTGGRWKICVDSTCETAGDAGTMLMTKFDNSFRLSNSSQANNQVFGMQIWSDVLVTNNPGCE